MDYIETLSFFHYAVSIEHKGKRLVSLLLLAGYKVKDIAPIIGVAKKTVYKWLKDIRLGYKDTI